MNIYITGGAKNGKSSFGEITAFNLSKELNLPLYYIATMIPKDEEDNLRIKNHREERKDLNFNLIECGLDISKIEDKEGVYLLDSVTALLANEMFKEGSINLDAYLKVKADLISLINRLKNVIIVSDSIYSDVGDFGELTEKYIEGLSNIGRTLINHVDKAYEVSFGIVKEIK